MHLVISCVMWIVPVVPTPHETVSPSVIDSSQDAGRDPNNKRGMCNNMWTDAAYE